MGYFAEFLNGEPTSDVLVNPARLNETADIIRKLYLIAQELPEAQFEGKMGFWLNDKMAFFNFFQWMTSSRQ